MTASVKRQTRNNVKVFIVTFDQFNVSLLNKNTINNVLLIIGIQKEV